MITQSHLGDINPGSKTTVAMNSVVHKGEHCVIRETWKGVRAYIFSRLYINTAPQFSQLREESAVINLLEGDYRRTIFAAVRTCVWRHSQIWRSCQVALPRHKTAQVATMVMGGVDIFQNKKCVTPLFSSKTSVVTIYEIYYYKCLTLQVKSS